MGTQEWQPNGWQDVLKPLAKLLVLLITRTPDGPSKPNFENWFQDLQNLTNKIPEAQVAKERDFASDLSNIRLILKAVKGGEEAKRRAKEAGERLLEAQVQQCAQMDAFIPLEVEPGPGETNPNGPRHDNDFVDYRKIRVLPTQQEILCELSPYLPKKNLRIPFVASPVDQYLDSQFRLLREDMIASVRRGVKGFFSEKALTKLQPGTYKYNTKPEVGTIGSASSDSVSLNIFRRVEIENIRPLLFKGICFEVSFTQPEIVSKMKNTERKAFWEQHAGSRMLEVGSLVGLALGMAPDGGSSDQLFFATVVDRDKGGANLYEDPKKCTVILSLLDEKATVEFAAWLASPEQRRNRNKEGAMLQVRGHFFAGYEPVLTTLRTQSVTTIPFLNTLVGKGLEAGEENPALLPPPSLANKYLDLSPLIKKESQNRRLQLEVQDFDQLKEELREREADLILDKTQIDAFALAMTRQVSLIQGPPGTGKTYVGIHIVRTLLHNSVGHYEEGWVRQEGQAAPRPREGREQIALHPILCICYTNHALDQFLEGLIKEGVPLDSMVRVGGRSSSEQLKARNLVELTSRTKTIQERKSWGNMKNTATKLEEAIGEYSTLKSMSDVRWESIAPWVEENYPEHYSCLLKKEEGFTTKGGDRWIVKKQWLQLVDEKPGEDIKKDDPKKGKKPDKEKKERSRKGKKAAAKKAKEEEEMKKQEEERKKQESLSAENEEDSRSIDELLEDFEVWKMNLAERRMLWDHWKREFIQEQDKGLPQKLSNYTKCLEKHREIDQAVQLRVLKKASIVGFTTSGSAKYQKLLLALSPKVIICEEAGEVLESHIVAALTPGTEQLILIGDHKQLRPKLSEYTLSIDSRSGYDLDVSLFERLVNESEERAKKNNNRDTDLPISLVTLDTQRRMRPEIADLVRHTLYPKLVDWPSVAEYPKVQGFQHNLWFLAHNNKENTDSSNMSITTTSYLNEFEANFVVQLVKYTVRQGYKPDEIAVLTPYVGQLMLLRKKLSTENMIVALDERDVKEIEAQGGEADDQDIYGKEEEEGKQSVGMKSVTLRERIRLATVDNFQGEEAEVVIISTVRNNSNGRAGFLKIDNRVNVMLSRAKHGMYVLGSESTLKACRGAKMFNNVLQILHKKEAIGPELALCCKNHGTIAYVGSAKDFDKKTPYGGCLEACGQRLPCGHPCRKLCHPNPHEQIQCLEKCARSLPQCGHPCERMCYEDCGRCKKLITLQHSCGHPIQVTCFELKQAQKERDPSAFISELCKEKVEVTLMCGHMKNVTCSLRHKMEKDEQVLLKETFSCKAKCDAKLPGCNHSCQHSCGKCRAHTAEKQSLTPLHLPCKQVCDRSLFCGHRCRGTCHKSSDCPPCSETCVDRCDHSHCGKSCSKACISCSSPCTWSCEHKKQCPLPCGSACIRLPCDLRCSKNLKCGHRCPGLCGEKCPDCCRHCASPEILDQEPDMVMFTKLRDHDPDDSPLILLSCKHVFTVETLDGHLELSRFYNKDQYGNWESIKEFDPRFPDSDSLAKISCPQCRQPISMVKRYGRIINRIAVINSQRKFVLEKSGLVNSMEMELKKAKEQCSQSKLADTGALSTQINKLVNDLQKMKNDCKDTAPLQQLWVKERTYWRSINQQGEAIPPIVKPLLDLLQLLLRAYLCRLQFRCTHEISSAPPSGKRKTKKEQQQNRKPPLEKATLDWESFIGVARELISACETSNSSATLSTILYETAWSHLLAVESFAKASSPATPTTEIQKKLLDNLDTFIKATMEILRNHPSWNTLERSFEEAKRRVSGEPFYQTVSDEEKKAVFQAMGKDVGTGVGSYGGHWYHCPNGHIYTIGECGGAMQEATCNECGARIGGNSHRLREDNQSARDFVRRMGGPS